MIKIPHNNGSPEYIPENHYGSHFDGEFFNFFETQQEADEYYANLPQPEMPKVMLVGSTQVKAALEIRGLTQSVETLLSSIEGERGIIARVYWSNEKEFNRYHGLIEELGEALKIAHPDFDIDEFFAFAQTIKL